MATVSPDPPSQVQMTREAGRSHTLGGVQSGATTLGNRVAVSCMKLHTHTHTRTHTPLPRGPAGPPSELTQEGLCLRSGLYDNVHSSFVHKNQKQKQPKCRQQGSEETNPVHPGARGATGRQSRLLGSSPPRPRERARAGSLTRAFWASSEAFR